MDYKQLYESTHIELLQALERPLSITLPEESRQLEQENQELRHLHQLLTDQLSQSTQLALQRQQDLSSVRQQLQDALRQVAQLKHSLHVQVLRQESQQRHWEAQQAQWTLDMQELRHQLSGGRSKSSSTETTVQTDETAEQYQQLKQQNHDFRLQLDDRDKKLAQLDSQKRLIELELERFRDSDIQHRRELDELRDQLDLRQANVDSVTERCLEQLDQIQRLQGRLRYFETMKPSHHISKPVGEKSFTFEAKTQQSTENESPNSTMRIIDETIGKLTRRSFPLDTHRSNQPPPRQAHVMKSPGVEMSNEGRRKVPVEEAASIFDLQRVLDDRIQHFSS